MKKLLVWLFIFFNLISLVKADVTMVWNTWNFQVNSKSILVGDINKDTDVKSLFWKITINEQLITEDKLLLNLDLRYLSWSIDKKVFDINDKITQWNKLYILFKPISDGWLVWENANISIETKNVTLLEYWNISNAWNNLYDVLWKVSYNNAPIDLNQPINNTIEQPEPVKSIDIQVIEQNNTWIKDNLVILISLLLVLWILFYIPNKKHIW